MDTLFRLVSDHLQSSDDRSYNNSKSSSSSSSKTNSAVQNHYYLHRPQPGEEICFNSLFMEDDDHFSAASSSSKHHRHRHPSQPGQQFQCSTTTASTTSTGTTTPTDQWFSSFTGDLNFEFSDDWASTLLLQTAIAIVVNNTSRIQQLMWMLNELGSPYGDIDQKLAFYFLQAMFGRVADSGDRCYRTLAAVSEKRSSCFQSMRRMVLKFQEVSPWMTFGHVASNGAIMEAFEGEKKLHIIDISNSLCTQWPTFLEALATRSNDTPHLRLTMLIAAKSDESIRAHKKVMREISTRMEKFARLMGVPFKFKAIFHSGDVSEINFTELGVNDDEAVAVNCVGALRTVTPLDNRRDLLISLFGALQPKIITVVEEEADLDGDGSGGVDFVKDVQECLRWFRIYFDSLDESFPTASDEQLMLERSAGRAVVDLLARTPAESMERRETAARWARRLREGGFNPVSFSEDVNDDVRALLRRYKDGWTVTEDGDNVGIFLAWKGQPVVWAAAWAPELSDKDNELPE